MRVFFDSSVLIASAVENHPAHERAFLALQNVWSGSDEGFIGQHSLAEVFAVLTALPRKQKVSAAEARRCIEDNFVACCEIVSLQPDDYRLAIKDAEREGWRSGMIYDALLLACARKINPDRILTLNLRHFCAIAPDLSQIQEP